MIFRSKNLVVQIFQRKHGTITMQIALILFLISSILNKLLTWNLHQTGYKNQIIDTCTLSTNSHYISLTVQKFYWMSQTYYLFTIFDTTFTPHSGIILVQLKNIWIPIFLLNLHGSPNAHFVLCTSWSCILDMSCIPVQQIAEVLKQASWTVKNHNWYTYAWTERKDLLRQER